MLKLRTYTVVPAIPARIARLRELAYNLWWSWNSEAKELIRRIEPDLCGTIGQNPVQFFAHLPQKRLDQAAADKAYLTHFDRVLAEFDRYLTSETWFARTYPDLRDAKIAYFSMEFGIHECLPFYAGGLGVLAGDHLKSASDLGLPLIGIGLAYRQGYCHQRLTAEGWQLEEYPSIDYYQAPLNLCRKADGAPLYFQLPIGPREVTVQVWKAQVGRIPLYLLDTDLPVNDPRDRELTYRLYGGDDEARIRQEVLLGIGGLRALACLGVRPDVCHMNEGHTAFLAVERIIQYRQEYGLDFGAAREAVAAGNVFTTHTPIPAGIDHFGPKLLEEYLGPYLPALGLTFEEFLAIGRKDAANPHEPFSMAILALRLAGAANGVSSLHGYVSREMWHSVWPEAPRDEVPITSITNGVHVSSWISPEMSELLVRYIGPHLSENPEDHEFWRRISDIPDLEMWRVHEGRRVALVAFARTRLGQQLRRRGAPAGEVKAADEALDPEALTIGFARRFAPYKRGTLLFHNLQRLARIVSNADRPVQVIYAGKAHPRDENGKAIIKEIIAHAARPEFNRRIVFLEDYDIALARVLVQGVDVWLNTPVKPREASGTSGMKVAVNGGLNLSVLDGWWPEAFDGENGWAIDEARVYDDPAYRDQIESEAIYDLLEKEIIPLFYDRGADGVPRGWIERMKSSMRTICSLFNSNRMVEEYTQRLYVPAAQRVFRLRADGFAAAKNLAEWKRQLAGHWAGVRVEEIQANDDAELPVGSKVRVQATVHLGAVRPDDVAVELYHGRVDAHGNLVEGNTETMSCIKHLDNSSYLFSGEIPCVRSGQQGYAVRVLPRHPDLIHRYDTGLILWS